MSLLSLRGNCRRPIASRRKDFPDTSPERKPSHQTPHLRPYLYCALLLSDLSDASLRVGRLDTMLRHDCQQLSHHRKPDRLADRETMTRRLAFRAYQLPTANCHLPLPLCSKPSLDLMIVFLVPSKTVECISCRSCLCSLGLALSPALRLDCTVSVHSMQSWQPSHGLQLPRLPEQRYIPP
jgi:hypothetical protein